MWNLVDPNNLPTEEVLVINDVGETLKGEFVDDRKFGKSLYVDSTDEDSEGYRVGVHLYNPVAYIKISDLKKLWKDQQN